MTNKKVGADFVGGSLERFSFRGDGGPIEKQILHCVQDDNIFRVTVVR
jgi:hypothetical protein